MRRSLILLLLLPLGFLPVSCGEKGRVVTTPVGSGMVGNVDGPALNASFYAPCGVAVDSHGFIYVADTDNSLIRKISNEDMVLTWAGSVGVTGSANGKWHAATFNHPCGIAADASGTLLHRDSDNHLVRKITQEGVVTTLAGSAGKSRLQERNGVGRLVQAPLWHRGGRSRYRLRCGFGQQRDPENHLGWSRVDPGRVLRGQGIGQWNGEKALFALSRGSRGGFLRECLCRGPGNNLVRKITREGVVTTLAGSGSKGSANGAGPAPFNGPWGLAVDALGMSMSRTYGQPIPQDHRFGPGDDPGWVPGAMGRANGIGTSSASFLTPRGSRRAFRRDLCRGHEQQPDPENPVIVPCPTGEGQVTESVWEGKMDPEKVNEIIEGLKKLSKNDLMAKAESMRGSTDKEDVATWWLIVAECKRRNIQIQIF